MRARYYRFRFLGATLTLIGIIVIIVAARGVNNGFRYRNSRRAAIELLSPPLLVEHCHYESCGHDLEKETELSQEQRQLKPKELAQLYNASGYQVSEERLRVFNSEPGLCPQCKDQLFVSVEGDKVAVFYGLSAGPCQLKEKTSISVQKLPPQAVADLKSGIPVKSQEELLYLLEGLMN